MTKIKVFEKKAKIRGSRSYYQMKDLAIRNTHMEHENHNTYQSKIVIKVSFGKGQGHYVKMID
jgi:hypothetical protein